MKPFRFLLPTTITSRIILPIIGATVLIGLGLYYFNLRFISETTTAHINGALKGYGRDIYNICDRHFTNFVEYVYLDPLQERIMQVSAIRELESFAQRHNIIVVLTNKEGAELISSPFLGREKFVQTLHNKGIIEVGVIIHEKKRYYAQHLDFHPWNWHFDIATKEEEFSTLTDNVKRVYFLTALIALVALCLAIVIVKSSILTPLKKIISFIQNKQRPQYSGIAEFELLSNTISKMMDSIESQEKTLKDITSGLAEGIIVQDTEGLLTFINPAAEKMLQWKFEELSGKNTHNMIHSHPEHGAFFYDSFNCPIINVRKTGISHSEEDDYFTKKDGSLLPVAYIASPLKEGETIKGVVVSFRDISERKRAEEERQNLQNQLHHSQKMEAIGLLAGGVAHDFNNMLTAIMGYCTLMKTQLPADSPLNRYLDNALASSEKASNLTRQLLTFSRKQAPSLKPVEINSLVIDLQKLIARLIGEDIEVKTTLNKNKLIIKADKGQIEQVIINLATNARDAMPEGGQLTISTGTFFVDELYARKRMLKKTGPYALISVADTGRGIAKEHIDKIFDPFFTTKSVGKGTGLGLSIVYGIVTQHQGDVRVYSELERGTAFKIYLPLAEDSNQDIEDTKSPQCPVMGCETILFAEDDEEVREIIKITLENSGYSVIEASNGEEAVKIFREQATSLDLFLSDMVMPKKNGIDAYQEIKAIKPEIKALFLSGYTADIINTQTEKEIDFEVLTKPISPKDLLHKIRTTLDKGK